MSYTTVAVAIAVLVGGTVLWLVGIVAVGQGLEDVCFDDLESRTRYGAYQSRAESVATVARVPTPRLRRRADRRSASPRGVRSIWSDRPVPRCVLPWCRNARAHSIVRLADCVAVHTDVARPPSSRPRRRPRSADRRARRSRPGGDPARTRGVPRGATGVAGDAAAGARLATVGGALSEDRRLIRGAD